MQKKYVMANRKKFMKQMKNGSIAVIHSNTMYISSQDMFYDFEPDREFFYLTGVSEPGFIFLAAKLNDEIVQKLFVYRKDEYEEKWTGYRLSEEEIKEFSGIVEVHPIDSFNAVFAMMMDQGYKNIYFNVKCGAKKYIDYITPQELLAQEILRKYPYLTVLNSAEITVPLRSIKSAYEINMIREAVAVTNRGILRMMKSAKPGINERELRAGFEYEVIRAGMKVSFNSIIAGGENALVLHYEDNNQEVSGGEMVLCDVGAANNMFCADVTRTFPINGKYTPQQRSIYDIVLRANEAVIDYIKPGVTFKELEALAKAVMAKGLMELGIMDEAKYISKYYYHNIGHGLGLNAHDPTDKNVPLKEGMVITVEPGLYVRQFGVGVRIEDDVLVTKNGCEVLTGGIIKHPDDIEKFMSKR